MLFLARRLLLGDRGATWTFPRAPVAVRALTAHRQSAAMTQSAIGADVHQTLDVHLNSLSQIAFDLALRFEHRTNPAEIVFAQIPDPRINVDIRFFQNRRRTRPANSVDVSKSD